MPSTIDELCRQLEERGEPYIRNFGDMVTWLYYSDPHSAVEAMDGTLQVTGLTPEQAITATVGPGTCHLEEMDIDGDTASEWMMTREYVFDAVYRCSCGYRFGHTAHNRPSYCPGCGAKVAKK